MRRGGGWVDFLKSQARERLFYTSPTPPQAGRDLGKEPREQCQEDHGDYRRTLAIGQNPKGGQGAFQGLRGEGVLALG